MTAEVITSVTTYVSALKDVNFETGDCMCANYVPSCFVSKDILTRFFSRHQPSPHWPRIVDTLWAYGAQQRKALRDGRLKILVEKSAMSAFISSGRVHTTNPLFELSFAERANVLKQMVPLIQNGRLLFSEGPIPFIFRVSGSIDVLIDVDRNTPDQEIQGLRIRDENAALAFRSEFERIWTTAESSTSGSDLAAKVDRWALAISRGAISGLDA